ncbi:meso-2,3-butanediol dehydrogenase-like [Danaus plexippus]|uniref:meso-2,3-butanediol dehydrogenase-like n=1 Tax=Danaus plexippus TaxID=13037 RepID=UPI002AB1DC20|nr:meso-2,3-butanediol dehydrogenase-like [Danaus plexippus]
MSFNNKVVLVTGASSGIGAAAAEAFSSEGAQVVMVGRNETKLSAVAAKCNKPFVIRADVADDDDARRIIDETSERFGRIDILINNAGVSGVAKLISGKIIDIYDKIMPINLRAVVLLTSLATPHLIKTKGNIVNISSVAARLMDSRSGTAMYNVSKAALNHFSLCAAEELSRYGVRVNTISPGPVVTDILVNTNAKATWDDFKKITCLDRVSDPVEIVDLIMFVVSDKAKSITGSNYVIDNGVLLKCTAY